MKKKTMIIVIIVIAVALVVAISLLVPAFAQESPDAQPTQEGEIVPVEDPEEITEEDMQPVEEDPGPVVEDPEFIEVTATQMPTPEPVARPNMASEPVAYKDNKVVYTYYDVVADGEKEAQVNVDEAVSNLDYGLVAVAQQLFGQTLAESPINPNSISLDNGNLYIDFSSRIYDVNMGVMGEGTMLDSIADAYLNNLPDVQAVYYSVDGQNYSSGHFEISGGEPFKTK